MTEITDKFWGQNSYWDPPLPGDGTHQHTISVSEAENALRDWVDEFTSPKPLIAPERWKIDAPASHEHCLSVGHAYGRNNDWYYAFVVDASSPCSQSGQETAMAQALGSAFAKQEPTQASAPATHRWQRFGWAAAPQPLNVTYVPPII